MRCVSWEVSFNFISQSQPFCRRLSQSLLFKYLLRPIIALQIPHHKIKAPQIPHDQSERLTHAASQSAHNNIQMLRSTAQACTADS